MRDRSIYRDVFEIKEIWTTLGFEDVKIRSITAILICV